MGFFTNLFKRKTKEVTKTNDRPVGKSTGKVSNFNYSTTNSNTSDNGIFGMGPVGDYVIISNMLDSSSDTYNNCHSHGDTHCHDTHSSYESSSSYDSGSSFDSGSSYDSGGFDGGSSGGDW